MSKGIKAMWMRAGTSKGCYFLTSDLPEETSARDEVLLKIMGSPDTRQINGIGGGDPLTSKVAIVSKSEREGIDVDYLFLQVFVDQPIVSDGQNCGNILAGVGPFAIEQGLVKPTNKTTQITIFMENTGKVATVFVSTPDCKISYDGQTKIDGVPGTSAPVIIEFQNIEGSSCGKLLPTGNALDIVNGIEVTMIDNGMPCVILNAKSMGISGDEDPSDLEAKNQLRERLEKLRLACGHLMNLGDVQQKTIPKMTLVSAAKYGGTIHTRTFIPHRCHKAIGVFGATSVATACLIKETTCYNLAKQVSGNKQNISIETPTGEMTIVIETDEMDLVTSIGVVRSSKKLMDGFVFT